MIVKTIGRGQDNTIVVKDENVSRVHLQIVQDDEGNVSVVDLGSTNGTYVNGVRISGETRLKSGDEVRIGDTKLPWQQYFIRSQQPSTSIHQTHSQPPKRKLNWLYCVAGVLLFLLVVGGVLIYDSKKETEKVRAELEEKKQQLERERNAADKDYNELMNQNKRTEDALNRTKKALEEHNNRNTVAIGMKGKKNDVTKKGKDEVIYPEIQAPVESMGSENVGEENGNKANVEPGSSNAPANATPENNKEENPSNSIEGSSAPANVVPGDNSTADKEKRAGNNNEKGANDKNNSSNNKTHRAH